MPITGVLAHVTVRDLQTAQGWYTTILGRGPDARPMDGLLEWRIGPGAGVQVWVEPERAGQSTVVLQVDDLDAVAARLADAGVPDTTPQRATSSRILNIEDPEGNRVVVVGA